MDYVAIGSLFVWCGLGDANKRKSLELAWIFREKEMKKKAWKSTLYVFFRRCGRKETRGLLKT